MTRTLDERNKESDRLSRLANFLLRWTIATVGVSTGVALIDVFVTEALWPLWTLGYIASVGAGYWSFRSLRASAYVSE